jgi:hypothetical protein
VRVQRRQRRGVDVGGAHARTASQQLGRKVRADTGRGTGDQVDLILDHAATLSGLRRARLP